MSIMFFSCKKRGNPKACKMLWRVTTVSCALKHINRSLCNTAVLCQLHTSNADSVALRKKEEEKKFRLPYSASLWPSVDFVVTI